MNSDSWCVKCAKYLAFGTFETADDSALRLLHFEVGVKNPKTTTSVLLGFCGFLTLALRNLGWHHNDIL